MKVLIGILAIDRDIKNINNLFLSLPNNNIDIIIITREMDTKIINFINNHERNIKLIKVDNYNISNRHNFENIAKKKKYYFFMPKNIIMII